MKVWIITVGEPLPSDRDSSRLYRSGMIAKSLSENGHTVLWWSSSFDHIRKKQRVNRSCTIEVNEKLRLCLLKGIAYKKNVSILRWANHAGVAREFRRISSFECPPEVILCSLPTLELCVEATRYGLTHNIPVVLDIRDLWPDIFVDLLPNAMSKFSSWLFWPMFRKAVFACTGATALVGITPGFLEWGLKKAARSRSDWDRVFPMAYSDIQPDAKQVRLATRRWVSLGINDERLNVCFLGTIGRQFDLDTVIAAARILENKNVPVRFILCGDGESRSRYMQSSEGVSSIYFPGWINAAETWTLMRLCSVGLAPYVQSLNFSQNLPNKPIEYMSAGLAIVSSIDGYVGKILAQNKCGITYANENVSSLVDAIHSLACNRTLAKEMGSNARRLYEERYSAETVYPKMVDYLTSISKTGILN